MSVHTMTEATEGLLPMQVWGMRGVYHNVRRILIDPSTVYEWNARGYLERIEFKLGSVVHVLTANGNDDGQRYPSIGSFLYLMFDDAARLIEIEKKIDANQGDAS